MLPINSDFIVKKPEYWHVLLNSVPTHGLALGAFALFLALFTKSRAARFVAISVIFVSCIMAYPVYELGEAASDKIAGMADDEGSAWLYEHEHRAQQLIWTFYALAGLSGAAMVMQLGSNRAGFTAAVVTLVLSVSVMGIGVYIASAGGKIRHITFRAEPAPKQDTDGMSGNK